MSVCLTVSERIAAERSLEEWPVASRLTDFIFFGASKPCCQGCACHSVRILFSLLMKQLTRIRQGPESPGPRTLTGRDVSVTGKNVQVPLTPDPLASIS